MLAGVLVELVEELHADLNHLVHGAVLCELAVGVAVLAVVGVVAHDLVAERHSAALAEMRMGGKGVIHRCSLLRSAFGLKIIRKFIQKIIRVSLL